MSADRPNTPDSLAETRKMRRLRAIRNSWPLLVWLIMCLATAYAYMHGVQFKRMNGRVFTYEQNVSALDTALIKDILVDPGDTVTANQVVVLLEDARLDHEIEAEQKALLADRLEHESRILFQIWDMRADLAKLRQEQHSEEAQAMELKREYEILLNMLKPGVQATTEDVVAAKASEIAGLEARITAYRDDLIPQMERSIKEAEEHQKELKRTIASLEEAIVGGLEAERAGMVLKSKEAGTVAVIHFQEGDTVEAGIPIMEIVLDKQDTIILGFIPVENIGDLRYQKRYYVSPMANRKKMYEAEVESIAPKISGVPDRASPLPDRIIRGRKIYLRILDEEILDEDNSLLPGEQVVIHLERPKQIPFLRWWK